MRISKEKAEQMATEITKSLDAGITAAYQAFQQKCAEVVESTIHKEVMACFKKHPDPFDTRSTFYLKGVGITRYIQATIGKQLPTNNSDVVLTDPQARQVIKLHDKWEELKEKKKTSKQTIYNTILALGSYKRITENLPEAAAFLPNATTTALILPIKEVRKEIKALTA